MLFRQELQRQVEDRSKSFVSLSSIPGLEGNEVRLKIVYLLKEKSGYASNLGNILQQRIAADNKKGYSVVLLKGKVGYKFSIQGLSKYLLQKKQKIS
jgi:hypothetical protein